MAQIIRRDIEPLTEIKGWGVDLPRENRPGIPRENPSTIKDAYGPELPRQKPKIKVNVSIEHRGLTPVFGESVAPKGLSGLLRAYAYRFGEGKIQRWMTLLFADRVDVIEERLKDLAHGKMPNPFKEGGWKADFRYDRPRLIRRGATYLGIGLTGLLLIKKLRR